MLAVKRLVENQGDNQDLGRGEQRKCKSKFPGLGGFSKSEYLGIVCCRSCHEKSKSVTGSSCSGKEVGGERAGSFGADFDEGGSKESQGQPGNCRSEPLAEGGGIKERPKSRNDDNAKKDPAQDHTGFADCTLGMLEKKGPVEDRFCVMLLCGGPEPKSRGEIFLVRVRTKDAGSDKRFCDKARGHADDSGEADNGEGPLDTNKAYKNEGGRQGVPWTGDQKGKNLPEGGASLIELHSYEENAVVAEVEKETGSTGAEDTAETPSWPEDCSNELSRNHADESNRYDTQKNSPPHPGQHFVGSMSKCTEPAFREGVAEEEVQEAGYSDCAKAEPEEPVDLAS